MSEFTPEELAVLKEMVVDGKLLMEHAQSQLEKRMSRGVFEGVKKENAWTSEEAQLFGLKNSLKSASNAHQNSLRAMASAELELRRTGEDVLMVSKGLEEFRSSVAGDDQG